MAAYSRDAAANTQTTTPSVPQDEVWRTGNAKGGMIAKKFVSPLGSPHHPSASDGGSLQYWSAFMEFATMATIVPDTTPTYGIRPGYPRLPLSDKLRAYLACARPFTWLAVLVGVLSATCMTITYRYTTWSMILQDWRTLIYGVGTLLMVVIGNNFVNQSTDPEDQVNRDYRPIVRGLIDRAEAATIGHLLWILAVLRAATLGLAFGIICTLLVLISYAYSHPPLRIKARPWLGNIGIGIARGGLGYLAAWSLWAPLHAPEAWAAAGVLTLFLIGATTAKDFADERGDRTYNVRTLVVKYGPERAALYSIPFILSPILLLPILTGMGYLHTSWDAWIIVVLFIAYFAYTMVVDNQKTNHNLEGTRPWAWMYLTLLILQGALAIR